ncbi:MAG: cytochrome c biogenesis protein ResB [Bacteroidales bacterium]|nr:cytochrome c biogenesis protein ResB [Bacteroidales bacterium]
MIKFKIYNKSIITLGIGLFLVIALSFISINTNAFAFPVNVFLLMLLVYFSFVAGRLSERFRFFSSGKTALLVSVYIIVLLILHWFFYHRKNFSDSLFPDSLYDFSTSALFVISWLFFLFVLGAVIVRRFTIVKKNNVLFLLNHVGLWVALSAGFLGRADLYTMQTIVNKEYVIFQAYTEDNQKMNLPFSLGLQEIRKEHYSSGEIKTVEADLIIKDRQYEKNVSVSVNYPYRYKGYDVYLMNAGVNAAKLQIVYDPWRYIVLLGIAIMFAGAIGAFFTGFKQSVLK